MAMQSSSNGGKFQTKEKVMEVRRSNILAAKGIINKSNNLSLFKNAPY
jgi:hypothetical protein